MVQRMMNTEDWEKFEQFGAITRGIFYPLTESSNVVVGKYKTERRDKRALRVAAYAPVAGAALGAAHGYNAAKNYTIAAEGRKNTRVAARDAREAKLGSKITRSLKGLFSRGDKKDTAPSGPGIIDRIKSRFKGVKKAASGHTPDTRKIVPSSISIGKVDKYIKKAGEVGKGIMRDVDTAGIKKFGGRTPYNVFKRSTKAGLIAGAAFAPIHSLARLHQKKKAKREEEGKRENF
jgi:hypothetical protein